MMRCLAAGAMIVTAQPAAAEVVLACLFPKAPSLVMRFPEAPGDKTLSAGGRPPVPLTEGQGSARLITAQVDGYDITFSPADSTVDFRRGGVSVLSDTGRCLTLGGPETAVPLALTPDPTPPAATPAAPADGTGKWQVDTETSAFDDSATVFLTLMSNEEIRGQFGRPGPASLHLRCEENTTALFLWVNDMFLSDIQGYGTVDYRIDDQKARSARMDASTSNKALGLWSGPRAIPLIKELLDGRRVVFRVTPYNDSPVEFSFDLTGIGAAVAPLRKACSW